MASAFLIFNNKKYKKYNDINMKNCLYCLDCLCFIEGADGN